MVSRPLTLTGVTKRYGAVTAVEDVNLSIPSGEFLTLLGPSGSGKTTVLMAIAGFVEPTAGRIALDGRDITAVPPEDRNFGMVFQGYALFPHLTVAENVAFPLRVRGIPSAARKERVTRALDLVQLSALADRDPAQLSGGQQQRVALARALVFDPHLLLLDEPLSALDKNLRADLQGELKALHERVGLSFIYVTHDQEEALSMSGRIAIMRDGRIVQIGDPRSLYMRPETRFVAGFLGRSNFLEGTVRRADGTAGEIEVAGRVLPFAADGRRAAPGERLLLALRPERISLVPTGARDEAALEGTVADVSYFGAQSMLTVDVAGIGSMNALVPEQGEPGGFAPGRTVTLRWPADAAAPVVPD